MNTNIIAGLIIITLSGILYWQHDTYVTYKATVETLGKAQEVRTKEINKQLKDNANDAKTMLTTTESNIHAYYKRNPVRVFDPSTCEVSGHDDNTSGTDVVSTTNYVTTYNPIQVEEVANRLDQLQKLLLKNGVTVEREKGNQTN